MLRNYLVIATRNMMNHKLYSVINIFGLALGMASCILMILFVRDELAYDKFMDNGENVYRVQLDFTRPNGSSTPYATSIIQVAHKLEALIPEVESIQYMLAWDTRIAIDDRNGIRKINYVAPDFFEMFPLPFAQGNPDFALQDINTAVVSSRLANILFPDRDAMGRTFILGKDRKVTITGILSPVMPHTHLETEVFVSRSTVGDDRACGGEDNWHYINCAYTYIQLEDGAPQHLIDDELPGITERYAPPIVRLGKSWQGTDWLKLSSIPVRDIHLQSQRVREMKANGDISLVYIFSFLALVILVIACINFTNLATARASDRSREISIRKIVGAERRQIIVQVLGESILLSILAMLIAISIIEIAMPYYNSVIGKELTFSYGDDLPLLTMMLALSVGVGFLGGIYPATFLSAFRPITLSKGVFANVDRHLFLRSTLVVVQFSISIALMCATFIVYAQMNYARSQALQFENDSILTMEVPKGDKETKKIAQFRKIIGEIDGVSMTSSSSFMPTQEITAGIVRRPGLQWTTGETDAIKVVGNFSIDPNFLETFGIDLVAGRNFHSRPGLYEGDLFTSPTKRRPETTGKVIINERTVEYLGFANPKAALGEVIDFGQMSPEFITHLEIIGVIPDVNFLSTRDNVEPLMMYMRPETDWALSIKLDSENTEKTVKWIKKSWELLYPDDSPQLHFVDESYDKLYAREVTRGKLFAGFSVLAMLIASLGLYGLASVAAERRTQEIGLRKVMGASVGDIIRLLVWQFSRPVLIANLIAWPVAFWTMEIWLSGFASRIDLTPTAFFAATGITLAIAFSTVTWHARKVAMAKPAETLRYE